MLTNSVMPAVDFLIYYGLAWLMRAIDQRKCCPNRHERTHTKTIQAFEELYSGPELKLHSKLAYVMNVVFITMMYGISMPLLFPVALLSLFIQYTVERMTVAQQAPAHRVVSLIRGTRLYAHD